NAVARAARTGRPELLQDVHRLRRPCGEDGRDRGELADIYRALDRQSSLILPLAARGQTVGVLFMATSVSGRSYGAEDLALGEDLARRAALAVDNGRLYREAQAANAAKDRFLATLSHELRTPLTPVLAVVSSLRDEKSLSDEVRSRLDMIRRNVELEARLIDDLLDLTRIARGKLELRREPSSVESLVEHALETCQGEGTDDDRLQIEIHLAADDHLVLADAPRLTQVFWNLLRNAFKFTPAGGAVRVHSWNEPPLPDSPGGTSGTVAVEIADTGMGIDPGLLPRIFDAFEQGDRRVTRQFGGLGLGLAITKAIVELHGGTLSAHSDGEGLGATFTVRLPLAGTGALPLSLPLSPPEVTRRQPVAAPLPAEPLRLLLVEDHPDTADAMADLLRCQGHQVIVARSVAAALGAVESEGAIDLVVSDLGLPDGSGLDLMRELAGRRGLRGIALSGYGTDEDVRRSLAAGFAEHLTKPVDFHTLKEAILRAAEPVVRVE
ncbi:MAG TPA: ATP-binding protein, partial [Thermoanaerobaculia bacterium]|nr:ATP-binding protein [Thermoanaerobaculia bacterium]